MTLNRIESFSLIPFRFDRDRVIGDSQVRTEEVNVVAVELIDGRGRRGLGFAQSLFTRFPDASEIERVFVAEAWPALEGVDPAAVALRVVRARGGNVRRMVLPFEEAIQHAAWDLFAKQRDTPLWKMLGAERSSVPVYASGLDYHLDDSAFVELFGRAAEQGFRGFKIKVGAPDIDRDLHRLDLLKTVVKDDRPIMIDPNEAWTAQETIAALKLFESAGHRIYWVEDPVPRDDIDGLRLLRRTGLTRINSGEYLDIKGKRRLLEARACDMLNVHGQISDVMRAGWMANDDNVEVTLGNSFLEVGVNMAVALPNVRWLEYSFQNFDHLVEAPFEMKDGLIHARDEPGHGLTLRRPSAATATDARQAAAA